MGHGADMWALGLLLAEMATGRVTIHRVRRALRPVCLDNSLLLDITVEVADALGDDISLFCMFACLLHRDPALRLSARLLQQWLQWTSRFPPSLRRQRLLDQGPWQAPRWRRCEQSGS